MVCCKTICNCEPQCVCDVVCVECRDERCRKCHRGMSRHESVSVRLRKKAWGRVPDRDCSELTDGADGPLPVKSATESLAEQKASQVAAELLAMEASEKSDDKKVSKNAKKKKRRQQEKAHESKLGSIDANSNADGEGDEGLVVDADDDQPDEDEQHGGQHRRSCRPSSETSDRGQCDHDHDHDHDHVHDHEACVHDNKNRHAHCLHHHNHHRHHHHDDGHAGNDHRRHHHGDDDAAQDLTDSAGPTVPTAAVSHCPIDAATAADLDDVAQDASIESVGSPQEATTTAQKANAAGASVHSAQKVLKRLLRAADLQKELSTAVANADAAMLAVVVAKIDATPIRMARLVAPELMKAAKVMQQGLASSGDVDAAAMAGLAPAVVVVEGAATPAAPDPPVVAVITASAVVAATGGPADGFTTPERAPKPSVDPGAQAFQAGAVVCAAYPWAQFGAFRDVELIQDSGSLAWDPHHGGSSAETSAATSTATSPTPRAEPALKTGSTVRQHTLQSHDLESLSPTHGSVRGRGRGRGRRGRDRDGASRNGPGDTEQSDRRSRRERGRDRDKGARSPRNADVGGGIGSASRRKGRARDRDKVRSPWNAAGRGQHPLLGRHQLDHGGYEQPGTAGRADMGSGLGMAGMDHGRALEHQASPRGPRNGSNSGGGAAGGAHAVADSCHRSPPRMGMVPPAAASPRHGHGGAVYAWSPPHSQQQHLQHMAHVMYSPQNPPHSGQMGGGPSPGRYSHGQQQHPQQTAQCRNGFVQYQPKTPKPMPAHSPYEGGYGQHGQHDQYTSARVGSYTPFFPNKGQMMAGQAKDSLFQPVSPSPRLSDVNAARVKQHDPPTTALSMHKMTASALPVHNSSRSLGMRGSVGQPQTQQMQQMQQTQQIQPGGATTARSTPTLQQQPPPHDTFGMGSASTYGHYYVSPSAASLWSADPEQKRAERAVGSPLPSWDCDTSPAVRQSKPSHAAENLSSFSLGTSAW